MKRHLICRADELHHHLEVFFREHPGWEDAYISASKTAIYATRINYDEDDTVSIESHTVYGV